MELQELIGRWGHMNMYHRRNMKTIILVFLLSVMAFGQELMIIDSTHAQQLKGRYGIYSEIDPISTFDGKFLVPTDCLTDKDLATAKEKLEYVASEGAITIIRNLPAVGQPVYKDSMYQSSDGLVKCRQNHNMTIYKPSQVPALFSFYRENSDTLSWIENEEVKVGWKRVYNGITYRCLQSHQTLSTWTPTATLGVLWASEAPPTSAWVIGVAYKIGDIVTYNGSSYQCLQAHTSISTWTPTATLNVLWTKL